MSSEKKDLSILYYLVQRKSHLCLPFLGIVRPQSRFPHLCVCEKFIYSQDRSTYFLQLNRHADRSWYIINRSQSHECGNWDCGRAIPFLSNCRYWLQCVSEKFGCLLPYMRNYKFSDVWLSTIMVPLC